MRVRPRRFWKTRVLILGLILAGCQAAPRQQRVQVQEPSATTRPFCFRAARAGDLRMLVSTRKPGPDGFPVAVVEMWNNVNEDVLVQYDVDSVVLHCGPYELHGPADVFGRRREILEPHEELNFSMPAGGWSQSATAGPRDLMIPTELPRGKYEMWATFRIAGANGGWVESDRNIFLLP